MENILLRKLSEIIVKLFDEPLPTDKDGFPIGSTEIEVLKGQMNILCEVLHYHHSTLEVK